MEFSIKDLQPSQFYLSREKIEAIQSWFKSQDLSRFEPISVKELDGQWIIVDGHSRLFVAYQAGLKTIPVALEKEDWNWDFYRYCIAETKKRGIEQISDLAAFQLSSSDYKTLWLDWCQRIYQTFFQKDTDT
ncbi:ParB/RepB/Spo0J family partition protein [Streptococcus merionis]|uniref:Putative histone acetyltransferase n=1 Tax=Streptococcus merionis TaxID=400065 RepID=A0A239SP06_9STRE|nr:ParB/RepB/Spo0J family partition protein [Streptococcus merionis]SNU87191.1 putative histone acetyltransferase [Streptococcus merionis]